MSQGPSRFRDLRAGQRQLSATEENNLRALVRELGKLEFDARDFVRQGGVVSLRPVGVASFPWEPKDVSNIWPNDGSAGKCTIAPSTVSNLMPDIGGIALDAATPPQLTIAESGVIYIKASVNPDGRPTGTTLEVLAAATLPEDDDDFQYIVLHKVTVGTAAGKKYLRFTPRQKSAIQLTPIPHADSDGAMLWYDDPNDKWQRLNKPSQYATDWTNIIQFLHATNEPGWVDFPQLANGDMIWRDEDRLQKLANPGATSNNSALVHDGTRPAWVPIVRQSVITDHRVDADARTLQIKTRDVDVLLVGEESEWTTVHTGGEC